MYLRIPAGVASAPKPDIRNQMLSAGLERSALIIALRSA